MLQMNSESPLKAIIQILCHRTLLYIFCKAMESTLKSCTYPQTTTTTT